MNIRKLTFAVTSALALAVGGIIPLAIAPEAQAAARDGACNSGEFCYYFNSSYGGSVSDFTGSVTNLGDNQPSCYDFKSAGNGKGVCTKNNAASVWNNTDYIVRIYTGPNYTGSYDEYKPRTSGNLSPGIKNKNASHQFISPSGGGNTSPASSTTTTTKLNSLINGTAPLHYGSSTKYVADWSKWGNWNSAVFGSQCKGFATAVFYELYGYNIGPYPSQRHTISINTSKTTVVFTTLRPASAGTLANLFQSARPGDFIQMSRAASQHSMIVYGVSSTGVWVYDANSDGANTVRKQFRDWSYFYNYMGSSSYGISVYRSK